MIENLKLIRNIFFKTFLVGLAFYLFAVIFWLIFRDWTANITISLYSIEKGDLMLLYLYFIGWMKTILLLLFLTPALALHWTVKSLEKKYTASNE